VCVGNVEVFKCLDERNINITLDATSNGDECDNFPSHLLEVFNLGFLFVLLMYTEQLYGKSNRCDM
jgi:hypothetical protein